MKKSLYSSRRSALFAVTSVTLAAGTLPFVGGCGGSGKGASPLSSATAVTNQATGRAVVKVLWPVAAPASSAATTRLIPEATNLVHLDVFRTVAGVTTVVGSGNAVRPAGGTTSTIEVDNLPIDTLTVVATAYPGTDPATLGTPVAQGSVPVTTQDGQVVAFSLTLSSTIDHLDVAPASPTVAPGTQQALTATAWNGPDETVASVVLLSLDQLQWASSDATLASVSPAGVVTGMLKGTPTITVTDAESGKTASTTVSVPLIITVSPVATHLSVTDSTTLTATVQGATNQAVTWSVVENGGGSVSASGVYVAPKLPGTYDVVAASVADPTKTATVALTAQAGNATGTIR